MKNFNFARPLCLLILCFIPSAARAQDWQVSRYDVTANISQTDRTLNVRAQITARNVRSNNLSTFSVRINPKATINGATVNDATATFTSLPEKAGNLQRIAVRLSAPVEPNGAVKVALEYRLPVADNSGLTMISPVGSQFLPRSFWYPTPNNPYVLRGAEDTAPFSLKVTTSGGETVVSSGKANGAAFEQTLYGQPFFLTGNWDAVEGANDARGITAYMPKGATADERKQADAIIAFASAARSFYSTLFGPLASDAPIKLVAVTRGAGFSDAGAILLDASAFRRSKVDSVTALLVAESVARLWIGGATPLRGENEGVVREGLARYLATLFMEKQLGQDAAEAERTRERNAYGAIARRDPPLTQTTPLDDTYFTATANKGAMIWRLVDRAIGRDRFLGVIRESLQTGARDSAGNLALAALRAAFTERGGAGLKSILDQTLDQPTDMDLLIGLPQQRGNQWVSAVRNTGSFDATVTVAGTTQSGERVTTQAIIPAREFGEAVFKTTARLVRVEIDPDKIYPQLDYANDVAPHARAAPDPLAELTRQFVQQQYAQAETLAREMLALGASAQETRILLARSLLALGKVDDAEKEFRILLGERTPTPGALAWANIGLGEISLRRNKAAEAARYFNEAVRADAEYASTLAARAGRIKAEAAAMLAPAPDDSIRAFLAQLDSTIKSGSKADLDAMIVPGELIVFSKGIIGARPEIWQTKLLRTEQLDANRAAADVSLNIKRLGREQSGTAVLMLARTGNGWKLAGIEFFEVR